MTDNIYCIPEKHYYRLHHVRPRFKDNVEDVLYFMSQNIYMLGEKSNSEFKNSLNNFIKRFPGNQNHADKTINNWRTEISALFGLIQYRPGFSRPSALSERLAKNSDLIEFFKYFLYYFQYPGGHLKSHVVCDMLLNNIKFKPVKYILLVMLEGGKINQNIDFGINQAECTHCIFNDLRATTGVRSPNETANLIINNRARKYDYITDGDVVRYAGDILDYMVLADLIRIRPNNKYYINGHQMEAIEKFIKSEEYFTPYDNFSHANISASNISALENQWFNYVNNINKLTFESDFNTVIEMFANDELDNDLSNSSSNNNFTKEVIDKLRLIDGKKTTKEIGDIGESLVLEHEHIRLTTIDQLYKQKCKSLLKKIPSQLAVGYDIASLEGVGDMRRYIEVKTTMSMGKLSSKSFHLTPSEWSAAQSLKDTYYIYRIMISKNDISLFEIKDPVNKYKKDLINLMISNGVDVNYSEKSGEYQKLLVKL